MMLVTCCTACTIDLMLTPASSTRLDPVSTRVNDAAICARIAFATRYYTRRPDQFNN
ncbi:hypothetical protein PQQ96_33685 [Paraburkholderia sediminicola]|uniref:hypothetical protein n=1 Tax=Paraburkholderia sediminicola TaxID=458836 RepID=UPI0038BBEB15